MLNKLQEIRTAGMARISEAPTLDVLQDIRRELTGKKSELNAQKVEAICKNLDKELKEVEDLAKID